MAGSLDIVDLWMRGSKDSGLLIYVMLKPGINGLSRHWICVDAEVWI
jgi:hypothetical protein